MIDTGELAPQLLYSPMLAVTITLKFGSSWFAQVAWLLICIGSVQVIQLCPVAPPFGSSGIAKWKVRSNQLNVRPPKVPEVFFVKLIHCWSLFVKVGWSSQPAGLW